MRRTAIGLLLALLIPVTALAATYRWPIATTSTTAAATLRDSVRREHHRVCGTWLHVSRKLNVAAKYKASDMGYRDHMSHTFVDGKHVWDFYSTVGIGWSAAGEILAWNTYSNDESPEAAFTMFMNSSSHKAIIRDCKFTSVGAGAFRGHDGKRYYAVEFIRS